MKKVVLFLCILAVAATCFALFAGCDGSDEPAAPDTPGTGDPATPDTPDTPDTPGSVQPASPLVCYLPDGAPALAMANVIASGKVGERSVNTYVTTGADVTAKCQSGEADMAILPTNAAVKICSVRNDYSFFSVNIQGLLYLVGTQQITSLADLAGKKVYSIGLGNTPEYVFKKILDVQSVPYDTKGGVTLEYKDDASTIIPMFLQGMADFAILGEPAVTNLIAKAAAKNITVYRLCDLQQSWQQATQSSRVGYPQAGLIVKKSLLQNVDFVQALYQAVFSNAEYLQNNVATLNGLMRGAGSSLDIAYTAEIIAACNIQPTLASHAKNDIHAYLATFPAMSNLLPLDGSIFYEQID